MKVRHIRRLRSVFTPILIVVFILVITIFLIKSQQAQIPSNISKQLNFQVLLPQKQNSFASQKETFKYDSSEKVLTFLVMSENNKMTIAEQAYPDVLIYDKLVGTLNEYAEIQTKAGKVALTKPKALNGLQTAVLSTYNGTSGVLMFAKPQKNMTNDQWQQFFNNLIVDN